MEIPQQHPGNGGVGTKASLEVAGHQGSVGHHGDLPVSVLEAGNEPGQQCP